ncbi:MAG: putative LPS assembly protein LptD [Chitinophagales bacterium]|nr:putative LPS assembly protein LptD [Chitinophagales bacterium]MDW8418801.1 putative LPS assembly protein LptD [Chitinophagales bacterium]
MNESGKLYAQRSKFSSLINDSTLREKPVAPKENTTPDDSAQVTVADTVLLNDTLDFSEQNDIKDPIAYSATDSMVYDLNTKRMYLHNGANIQYQKIKLNAHYVDFDWNDFTLTAKGTVDSNGAYTHTPVFEDAGTQYEADSMKYNFKTRKGLVYKVSTQEGESYLHSEVVKKNQYDEWYGKGTKYTTCDQDHPHFYFKARRVKMVPNKVLVTGPANLWVGDVPTPLVVPFGLFPVKQGRKSGLIMPEYGSDGVFGFFLRGGGYYWAVNDYLGLRFTGQVATNGTFGAGVSAQYAWRYKFTGNLSFNYLRSRPPDPDLPGARSANSYSFTWTHNQDPKSIPNSTFGANVHIQSADFFQVSRNTSQQLLQTTFNSGVNFTRRFGNFLGLNMFLRHTQNILNRYIGFTLPEVTLSMSRINPFKSKISTAKPRWYENIGIIYNISYRNLLETTDSTLFRRETLNRFRMGLQQTFRVDAPTTIFKYFNVNPSFDYTERTYFKTQRKRWDPDTVIVTKPDGSTETLYGRVITDTAWGFGSARNFLFSVSANTKLIGIFRFKKAKIKAIKHVITPTVSFNYQPDFGNPRWGYYRTVQADAQGRQMLYPVFGNDAVFGNAGPGRVASVTWSLLNNFDMKVFSKKDTVRQEKNIGLLDQVNLAGGYNFIADSLRLLPFTLSVQAARVLNLFNINTNVVFDPYARDSLNRPYNTFEWEKSRRLLRFDRANVRISTSFGSRPRQQVAAGDNAPRFMADYVTYNPYYLYDFDIPWSVSLSYMFDVTRGITARPDTVVVTQTINGSLDFNLTPKWKFAISSGFDITRKQVTLTNLSVIRDLHCWELNFAWTPPLPTFRFQQFTVLLHPKSGMLRDLRLQKRNALVQDL